MSTNGLQLDPAVLQLIAASGITPDEFAGLTRRSSGGFRRCASTTGS
jgi:hypothetical protein